MPKKSSIALILAPILLIVMGVMVYFLSKGSGFDTRNRASTPTGTAEIKVSPETHHYFIGDYFKLDMMLGTGGKAISGAGFRLSYPFTTAVPEIEVLDNNTNATGIQIQSFASSLNPDFTQNVNLTQLTPATNGTVSIDYGAVISTTEGYSNTSGQKFAQISFLARRAGTFVLQHDPQRSQITDKATGLDVLKTIDPISITVATETQAPAITITSGLAENASTTSATVNFTYTASDLPVRQANVFTPLTSTHKFDAETPAAYTALASNTRTISKVLAHGAHTLTIYVKDPQGNVGTVVRHFTVDATPHINSITPTEGTATTEVTIYGYNFTGTTVKFGTIAVAAADYVSRSATQMVVKVPVGANGQIKVIQTGVTPNLVSNGVDFQVRTRLVLLVPLQGLPTFKGTKTAISTVVKCGTFRHEFTNVDFVWGPGALAHRFDALFPVGTVVPAATNCTVSIKETSRLRKRFTGLTMAPGIINTFVKNTAADTMLVADFDNNNKLELQDYGLLMANFSSSTGLTVPVTAANAKFDLNGDGNLTIDDIALLLTNLTTLQRAGDPE